ncbi:MAG: hypothetical protein M0019_01455 [Actinomycetota bacterium]|nr:hypothetical protein [Actinomycetota bacterium]
MKTSTPFRPLREIRLPKAKQRNGTIATLALALIALGASVYSITSNSRYLGVTSYLPVATSTIVPGVEIQRSQVQIEPVTSRSPLAYSSAFEALSKVVGEVSTAVIAPGSIISQGELSRPKTGSDDRILSFALPLSHAAGGLISAGDRVDILANEGSGTNQVTVALARGVKVVSVTTPSASLSTPADPNVTITVAISSSTATLMVVNGLTSNSIYVILANSASAPNDSGIYIPSLGQ